MLEGAFTERAAWFPRELVEISFYGTDCANDVLGR
jgi:hypothetical protein